MDKELDILLKYGITIEEWFVTKLIFLCQEGDNNFEYLKRYVSSKIVSGNYTKVLTSLQDKGIILKSYKIVEGQNDPRLIPFNKTFLNKYIQHSGVLGKELFDAYPSFGTINGHKYSLKNICSSNLPRGGFMCQEDFFFEYSKSIGHSIEKHKEILDILSWAVDLNLINTGIVSFVASKKWEELAKIREEGVDLNGIQNYNTIEAI